MKWDYNLISGYLEYSEESCSGLMWKVDVFTGIHFNTKTAKKGTPAGCFDKSTGYYFVRVNKILYPVHRLILFLHGHDITGKQVDHIDGNRSNNLLSNLRIVSARENRRNMKKNIRNKTGITGVSYNELTNKEGRHYRYYTSKYTDHKGRRVSKMFNIDILGEELAFKLACEFRENGILETNELLENLGEAGYTDRHGKT